MSLIGEATLSAFFEALFTKLASFESLHHFATEKQAHKELKKLENVLRNIQAVLADAEEKQMKDQHVKIWLAELQDLAYDADDFLDEFATEALGSRLMQDYHQGNRNKVQKIIHMFTTKFNPNALLFSYKMMWKIKGFTVRLQDLVKQKTDLALRENGVSRTKIVVERPPTTSLVNEAIVYGREDDKKAIMDLLLMDDHSSHGNVYVIPIVGIGGIGKTTLAQLVYNDDSIKDHFDIKAWVCVSEDFDVIQITKTILQSVTSEVCSEVNDLNLLQVKLKEKLCKKNFLLVLDDYWNESYYDWTILRSPFEIGTAGSKIIVTTRTFFRSKRFWRPFRSKEIGEQIVKKCNGLPLAANTIGGLLRTRVDPDAWKDVLENEIWNSSKEKCGIIPALWLSYHHLPANIKQCFAYCSIFPKDYEFREEEIVLLWKAEGLLQQANSERKMGKLGSMYFQDLVSRSLFQISSRNKSRFVMHDLINDLAQSVAGELCFRVEGDKKLRISRRARYSSYIGNRFDGLKKFDPFYETEHLRTFLPFMLPKDGDCFLSNNVLIDLLPKLRRLRVLSLEGYYITEIPDSFGGLSHIRFLNFSYTKIKTLPDSICTLFNLETLLLKGCDGLRQLPSNMRFLSNLEYLDITDANSIGGMPFGIGELTDLQVLSNFVVGQGVGCQIRELKNLSQLEGRLSISGLENLINVEDALEARLFDKSSLDDVELNWSANLTDDDLRNEGLEKEVLSLLQPCQKVKKISIKNYGGLTFPAWIGDSSFKNLVFLTFEYCRKCTSLPSVGKLPSLKALHIKGMNSVRRVGLEFYGENCHNAFPSLEILHFEDMPELKEWNPHQVDAQTRMFNCLKDLSITKCPKLLGNLPTSLPCLEKLVIHECQQLVVSIPYTSSLYELDIVGCKEVLHERSLDLCSFKKVSLSNIAAFTCLTDWSMSGLTKTEFLRIGGCRELTSLWQNNGRWLAKSSSLLCLEILNCPQLVSMEVGEEKEEFVIKTFCNLEYLRIKYCERLEKLSTTFHNLTSLRELEIVQCPRLVSFTHYNLPPTLKVLVIKNCENLRCLLDEDSFKSSSRFLSHLMIERCPSLISVSSSGELPLRLQHLKIWSCSKLTCLSSSGQLPLGLKYLRIDLCQMLESIAHSVQYNTCLEFIFIGRCEKIQFLPDGLDKLSHLQNVQIECSRNLVSISRLPSSSLRVLRLSWCRKLQALPNGMHILSSLLELEISNCLCLFSFPEEGFPTNLTSLTISSPAILEGLIKWGMHKLTSLKRLTIKGGYLDGVSFPDQDKGMMLPCSLRKLAISDFPNVEILSSNRLPSLECLCIVNCPKLKSLPGKDTLLTVLELYIHNCPLLKQRCKKDEGQDWSSIAHIPFVQIDNRFVYDSEAKKDEFDSEE